MIALIMIQFPFWHRLVDLIFGYYLHIAIGLRFTLQGTQSFSAADEIHGTVSCDRRSTALHSSECFTVTDANDVVVCGNVILHANLKGDDSVLTPGRFDPGSPKLC